jgi:type II secretory pathway component GspD/PulD (secretin)
MNRFQLKTQAIALCVTTLMLSGAMGAAVNTESWAQSSVDPTYFLDTQLNVPGGSNMTSIDVIGGNIRNILRDLSLQAGMNLVLDESVNGNISVTLSNVTINHALQTVCALGSIEIVPRNGNIYIALSRQAAIEKGLNFQLTKVIKVRHANAARLASILNASIFAPREIQQQGGQGNNRGGAGGGGGAGGAGGQQVAKVQTESRTNSLIIIGTAREIELAEEAVNRLDRPRETKTFYLSHVNAIDLATMLASSIYNDGVTLFTAGGGGGAGGAGGGGGGVTTTPAQLRTELENVTEGSGSNQIGGGGGGGAGQGAGGTSLGQNLTLRATVKQSTTASVSPDGPILVPDARTNSLTIMGTPEQILLAEQVIPNMDARVPQVAIEVSLVEINEVGRKELSTLYGSSMGTLQFGYNNQSLVGQRSTEGFAGRIPILPGQGLIGLPTQTPGDPNDIATTAINLSTNPISRRAEEYAGRIRALVTQNRAKVLANPTVVTDHDHETMINIVDEIVRNTQVQINNGATTTTVVIGEAGITLDVLPKIGEDGTVTIRVRPSITSVRDVVTDAFGNITTLLSRRDLAAQNIRVRDNETLVMGGLTNESSNARTDKLPLLGDLPIVGAMFRSSTNNRNKTELVLMITPHILNKTIPTPTHAVNPLVTVKQ